MQHNSSQKTHKNQANNRGNALVIILVLIVLIAALTAVAMRSTNRSSTNMDSESARIHAEKLMRQASAYESAVNRLRMVNQCSENEISFENEISVRDYSNSRSPTDLHCNIFNIAGAGQTYSNVNSVILDPSLSSLTDYQDWVFTANYCILGLGSDDNDTCTDEEVALIAVVPHINTSICMQINEMNGIENTGGIPPVESFDNASQTFDGDFETGTDAEIGEGATGVNLMKHATGCFTSNSGAWTGSNIFYHALLIR